MCRLLHVVRGMRTGLGATHQGASSLKDQCIPIVILFLADLMPFERSSV